MNKPLIYSLIVCVFLVTAPHAEHLPLWVAALSAMLLIWRAYLAHTGAPLPARWLLMVITLGGVLAIGMSFHTLFGREVGVTLLMLLSALKLLELRGKRDAIALIFLSCFLLITHFFYSQSIVTAALMLSSLFVIVATWLRIHAPNIASRAQLRIVAILLLQAIPLMLVLFVFFPRVQGPLWGLPQDAYNSSGLSDNMSPGSLSKLTLSEAVAFRVTYQNKTPRRDQMYWRGPVLWQYDGRTWTAGVAPFSAAMPQYGKTSQSVSYSVVLEPHNKHWLYALDVPTLLPANAHFSDDMQIISKDEVTTRIHYDMSSSLVYQANREETPAQRQRGLQLPAGLNPRALALAASWRATWHDDANIIQAALKLFNQEKFIYTLEPPLLGRDAVDDFLFQTRQGFCEHYASAFVYLMRAAGIPARVVTGYLGGEFNALGNYTIVRQSDAHAWAEVWLAGQGWVRIDPTAAIAPERVQKNLAAAVKDNAVLPFMARNPPQWMRKLRLNADALSNQWNLWVLGYNPERQFALLTRWGMGEVSWENMVRNLVLGLAALLGIFALFMFRHLLARETDPVQGLWLKLGRRLRRVGLERAPHEGALDFAQRVAIAKPHLRAAILNVAQQYVALRYGAAHDEAALRAFKNVVRAFKL